MSKLYNPSMVEGEERGGEFFSMNFANSCKLRTFLQSSPAGALSHLSHSDVRSDKH